MAKRPLAHEDNAVGNLLSGISAVTLTIPLESGDGALLPTTYSGSATSGGSSTTLNSTGIGASGIAVGDMIENVTDGSYAIVVAVGANSLTTTPLIGGTDNTWQNADAYAVNRFVVTLVQYDTNGTDILKREKLLIGSRSGDTLTVATGGRGYDGSTAQSFDAGDYIYNFTTAASFDGIKQAIVDLFDMVDDLDVAVTAALVNKISVTGAEIYGESAVGTDAYAVTLSPAPGSLTDGMVVRFKADVANTGNATLNVNGLGAKNILKNHDQTLANGDIEAGQMVYAIYNADTDVFEMLSHTGNVPPADTDPRRYLATFGHQVLAGMNVAIESDGNAYMTRPTAVSSGQLTELTNSNTSVDWGGGGRVTVLDISSTIKAFLYKRDTGTAVIVWDVITIDPEAGTFTRTSGSSFGSPTASEIDSYDIKLLDSDTAIASTGVSSKAYAKIIDSIADTSPDVSISWVDCGAAQSTYTAIEKISATEAVLIKSVSGTGLQSVQLQISGTTITTNTTATLLSTTNNVYPKAVIELDGADKHLIVYHDDTDNQMKMMVATWSGGQYTSIGTPVVIQSENTTDLYNCKLDLITTDKVLLTMPNGSNVPVVYTITVTGNVPAVDYTYTAGTSHAGGAVYLTKIDNYHYLLTYATGASPYDARRELLELDPTTYEVAIVGSTVEGQQNTYGYFGVKLNEEKVVMLYVEWDNTDEEYGIVTITHNMEGYIGIVDGDAAASETEYVVTHGLSETVSGLTAGQRYFPTLGGAFTTNDYVEVMKDVGVAFSATSIYKD